MWVFVGFLVGCIVWLLLRVYGCSIGLIPRDRRMLNMLLPATLLQRCFLCGFSCGRFVCVGDVGGVWFLRVGVFGCVFLFLLSCSSSFYCAGRRVYGVLLMLLHCIYGVFRPCAILTGR